MTLELKKYGFRSYLLRGVESIIINMDYDAGHFAIVKPDTRENIDAILLVIDDFEYIKDIDSGKYFVKNGKWVDDDDDDAEMNEKKIRNEAIKEFAERLKNTMSKLQGNSPNKTYKTVMNDMLFYYVPKIIDDVVEEMTEA